jgi:heat shock protein HtpX
MGAPSPRAGRRHTLRNVVQELLLLGGLAVLAGAAAWLLAGPAGALWVLLAVVLLAALRPRVPVAWVLSAYRAQPLPRWVAPQLHELVDVLAVRARLRRRPTLFYVASPLANAFVVGGPDGAALAVTDGLLRLLGTRELCGVLAHELSHLRHGDTSVMNLSDLVARLAQWVAWLGLWSMVLLVVVPLVVTLLQLALSRSREYDADVDAAALTGDPEGLARALLALEARDGQIWERILVGRSGRPDPLLLRTHPGTEERVRRLRALSVTPGHEPVGSPDRFGVAYPPVEARPRLRRSGVWW